MIWEIRHELIGYLDLASRRSLAMSHTIAVLGGRDGGWGEAAFFLHSMEK